MTRLTVWSPQRRNRRDVDVYLPASYDSGRRRYPVVYMQDGQNLSDPSAAFAGTWRLDDVLRDLASRDIDAIVVGVHNTRERLTEYSPFPDRKHGGGAGASYVSFLAGTLKPRIDRQFRTRRMAAHTVVAGSSMGALISLYAWFLRPDVFGHAGVLSPSLWYGRERLFAYLESSRVPRGRIHLDVGTGEGAETLRDARALKWLLEQKGIGDRLSYLEDRSGRHEEAAWSRRIGGALEFLLQAR
jgi:isoamylase